MKNTFREVMDNSIWVIKLDNGGRYTGRYPRFDKDGIRDLDLVCWEGQPEELQEFFKDFDDYNNIHGFTSIPEFYALMELAENGTDDCPDEEEDFYPYDEDASGNMACDNTGYCSESMSCPNYFKCKC